MSTDVLRLARYVTERRQQLDLSQLDVARRGGPSDTTLGKIEAGAGAVNRQTLSKLDAGLGWVPGSARSVLEGGEPTVAEPSSAETAGSYVEDALRRGIRARNQQVHKGFGEPSYLELWQTWSDLFIAQFSVEVEYAQRRGIDLPQAREELMQALFSAQQVRDGRRWIAPWEPSVAEEVKRGTTSGTPGSGKTTSYLRGMGAAARDGEPSEPSDADDNVPG